MLADLPGGLSQAGVSGFSVEREGRDMHAGPWSTAEKGTSEGISRTVCRVGARQLNYFFEGRLRVLQKNGAK